MLSSATHIHSWFFYCTQMESSRRPPDSHYTNCSTCTFTDFASSHYQNTQAGVWRGQSEPCGCPGQGEPGAARAAGERLAGSMAAPGTHPTESCFSSVEFKQTHTHLQVVVSKTWSLGYFYCFFNTTNSNSKKHFKNETTLPSRSVTEGIKDSYLPIHHQCPGHQQKPHMQVNPQHLQSYMYSNKTTYNT